MTENKLKKPSAWMYLLMAMIAFGCLGLEFGVLFISRIIDGRSLNELGQWPIHWYGAIAHWMMTIIVWLTGAFLIMMWAKRKKVLDELIDVKHTKKVWLLVILAVCIVIISAVIQMLINDAVIPQVLSEYRGFVQMYGDKAWIVIFFQVLYYVVEMLLVLIMIVLFQRCGELLFKHPYIPYGSIGLMLTWGMIHFLSHPAGALGVTLWALIPGLLFVYGKKKIIPVYILLVLGFII